MSQQEADSSGRAPPSLEVGSRVDHFQVVRLVGRGGMGDVYLARDTLLGRKVALKVIHADRLGNPELVDRFLFEARVTARFNHPHIVTIFAVGQHGGRPYLALEYLEGQTLRERLTVQPPSVREAMRMGLAIAEALQEAHAQGILHRDLKPENVHIQRDGRLRVLDFGLAKAIAPVAPVPPLDTSTPAGDRLESASTGEQFRSHASGARGTPAYMAPEQWRHQEGTDATDIWALGVMLYELVVGERPFLAQTRVDLALKVAGPDPAPTVAVTADVPQSLATLIDGCLQKDPRARPKAREVADVLRELLAVPRTHHAPNESPFRGLLPFGEQHADFFFGRDAEVAAALERLREEPVLAVVGPSGSGKSSFVQAGVIPRLREQGHWIVLRMRPGSQPWFSLASRLVFGETAATAPTLSEPVLSDELDDLGDQHTPSGPLPASSTARVRAFHEQDRLVHDLMASPPLLGLMLQRLADQHQARVLLFVDQLEELQTLVTDPEVRRTFLQAACLAADDPQGPVRVVFTLRDDFLVRLAAGREARDALSRVTVLRPLGSEGLRQAITEPVRAVGYRYDDPALVEEMVAAVQGERAALPVLQFAGRMLWERRDRARRLLLRSAYEAMGGVAGALASHADGVLSGLSAVQLGLTRDILLRLVSAEGTRVVLSRQRVLDGLPAAASDVLDRLIEARLLSVRKSRAEEGPEEELEVVHESLIHVWKRLAQWVDESREERAFLNEATQAADLWQRRGRRLDEVWQGDALREALRACARLQSGVPDKVKRFLEAGQKRERRKRVLKRAIFASGATLLLVVTVVAVLVALAFDERKREAQGERQKAEQKRSEAELRQAEAQREGALAALLRGDVLEARAKVRSSLTTYDSTAARAAWWRLQRDPLLWRLDLGWPVNDVAYSPREPLLAAAAGQSVHVIDARTRATRRVLRGHDDRIYAVTFSPDGRQLASGSWQGRVTVWDLAAGAAVREWAGEGGYLRALAFAPDGQRLAWGSQDRSVRIWQLSQGGEPTVLTGHEGIVLALAFSPAGDRLASADDHGHARVWDVASGRELYAAQRHGGQVNTLAWTPDGSQLVSGGDDGRVVIGEPVAGRPSRFIQADPAEVTRIALSADGRALVAAGSDRALRLFAFDGGRELKGFQGHTDRVRGLAFSPDGRLLASGSWDGTLRLWDVATDAPPALTRSHAAAVFGVAVSPEGRTLATSGADRRVLLWDVASGEVVKALSGHQALVFTVAFSPDGQWLASGSEDTTVRLWDLTGGQRPRVLEGHTAAVMDAAFSPGGRFLASASWDKTVRVWDLDTGAAPRVLRGHTAIVRGVAFHPDGRRLASASVDGAIRIWDTDTGELRQVLDAGAGALESVDFHPDGRTLAAGHWDATVRLWDLDLGKSEILGRHGDRAYRVRFSPDGRYLGSTSADRTARVWDLANRTDVVLAGHRAEVNRLAFTPDGARVVTTSDDGTVRYWDARSGRPVWRAPLLLPAPPRLFTDRGWVALSDPQAPAGRPPAGRGWREAVEVRARAASVDPQGRTLCIRTYADELEYWLVEADRLVLRAPLAKLDEVLALPAGCVTRAAGVVRLYSPAGDFQGLETDASALAPDAGGFLVAAPTHLRQYDAAGRVLGEAPGAAGVTALLRTPNAWFVGFEDGVVERRATRSPSGRGVTTFESVPPAAVVRLVAGPMDTVVAGFANGVLGLWQPRTGARLDSLSLHGPVVHLHIEGRVAYAATSLGDRGLLDLSVFHERPCDLLRDVWQRVPVVWEDGQAVVRPPPTEHRCRGPLGAAALR